MQILMMLLIVVATTFEYLGKQGWMPKPAIYLEEISALIAAAYIVIAAGRTRFAFVRPAYWFAFGMVVIIIVFGAIANQLAPGPMFAGLRTFLRPMPLFLLPAVFEFSERNIRAQFLLLLGICVVQFPVSIYQHVTTITATYISGDRTVGTIGISSLLSIFLICAMCVLAGFYIRKRISLRLFALLFVIMLVPTTINETKGTLFLLPFGILTTFIVGSPRGARFRNGALSILLLAGAGFIFVTIYDSYMTKRYGYGIVEFFMMPGRLEGYLDKGRDVGSTREAGRVDAIQASLEYIAQDPVQLAFGLGIGSVSDSALGPQYQGHYFHLLNAFAFTAVSLLLFEVGVLGLLAVFWLFWLIFRDSQLVAGDESLTGTLAVGWTGVVATMGLALFYKQVIASGALSFLFWYFSGLIAAHRMRLDLRVIPLASKDRRNALQEIPSRRTLAAS
jgi:hypothetical protein